METKSTPNFWWLKNDKSAKERGENGNNLEIPLLNLEISSSLAEFLEKEENISLSNRTDKDVGLIIDEINRVAAQSPLGPYERSPGERSVDDIMKEAERIYMESSKSFEQLSQRSRTPQTSANHLSKESTPTPKSVSPLPRDSESDTYSEDFSGDSKTETEPLQSSVHKDIPDDQMIENDKEVIVNNVQLERPNVLKFIQQGGNDNNNSRQIEEQCGMKDELIKELETDNKQLRQEIRTIKTEFEQTTIQLEEIKALLMSKSLCTPEINVELEKTLEELKDAKEINTALQLQLDTINKSHCLLKHSYDDVSSSNRNLERRLAETDATVFKYKNELMGLQSVQAKLVENEENLNKLLEIEKLQSKSLKLQNEKNAKYIQDLNRQIKEMERIIARKHPDSVSALIVAAKNDVSDINSTARKILEDRIKTLEEEAAKRDNQSSKVFVDIQDKFNQMKLKYESHIEDLELHVNDLKNQLKRKSDTYDIYTQTFNDETLKIPQKDTFTVFTQTDQKVNNKKNDKFAENKEDSHLVATIRGLKVDLSNKEKVMSKLQREIDELKKTNRKLQKEREGSLKNLNEKKDLKSPSIQEQELKALRTERDKIKQQLCRIEQDYQGLKTKRLHDLTALQEAHEREVSNYVSNMNPLREQLELQQVTISTLQSQLTKAKEELLIMTVERDHLTSQLNHFTNEMKLPSRSRGNEIESLQRKISYLEKRYEEREVRLRAIVQDLARKNLTNRSCEQCTERQKELISYKLELDHLLETLRSLE